MNLKITHSKKNTVDTIPFYKLFKFLTKFELFLYGVGISANVLSGISIMILQLLIGNIIGNSITDANADVEGKLILYLFVFVVIVFTLKYISRITFSHVTTRQTIRIRSLYLKKMLNLDVAWHDLHRTSEFASTVSEDITKFQEGTGETMGILTLYFVKIIVCVTASFAYLWEQTLIIVYIIPFVIIINLCFNFAMLQLASKESNIYNKANSIAEEVLTLIKVVMAYSGRDKETINYANKLNEAKSVNIKKALGIGINIGLSNLFSHIFLSLQYWYATTLLLGDKQYNITYFLIVFFNGYVAYQGISHLPWLINRFTAARTSAFKIFAVIESESNINKSKGNGIKMDCLKGEIEFKNVEFVYPSRSKIVLNGLSFKVKSGETIALVGESGCGKSSCIQLLQRFYDTTTGEILIDGINIKNLDVHWLRNNIATVEQEPSLFNTTIAENITYGNMNATQEDVEEAAKQANIHHYVSQLSEKYDTIVGESGAKLSGGQKQRIAIARAIVKKPNVLLLDEATSALDRINEIQIQETIFTGNQKRTTIIVAHNLSTIRCVDKIIYIKDGIAVEIGTHDELIAKKSYYYDLVNAQTEASHLYSIIPSENNSENNVGLKSDIQLSDSREPTFVGDNNDSITLIGALKTLISMCKNKIIYVVIASIFMLISALLKTISVVYFGPLMMALDNIENEKSLHLVYVYALCIGMAGVIMCFANIITFVLMAIASESLIVEIRKKLFSVLLNVHGNDFQKQDANVGSSCVILCNQPRLLQLGLSQPLAMVIEIIITLLVFLIISMFLQWRQGLIMLTAVIISLIVIGFLHKLVRTEHMTCDKALIKSSELAVEAIRNIRTIAALNAEEKICKLYEEELLSKLAILDKANNFIAFVFAIKFAINSLGFLINTYFGRLFVTNHLSTPEDFATISLIHIQFMEIIRTISFTVSTLLKALISSKEIVKTLGIYEKKEKRDRYRQLAIERGNINYENVHFAYPNIVNKNILKGITLSIHEGKTIALIGSSGCGKTTLVSLLLRFFDPTSGTITVNEKNISTLHKQNWRKLIGIVFQEPYLFNRTIAENIAYGANHMTISELDVIAAAKTANIHNFVKNLPLGYETRVGTKGIQLSGGQKQRIAIARALIRNPHILILDEATSSLDKQNEKIVQESLKGVKEGRTCIIIAHRLTTIQDADVICVLDDGKIKEYPKDLS